MRVKGCPPGPYLSLALLTLSCGEVSKVCFAASSATDFAADKLLRSGRSMPRLGLQIPDVEPYEPIAWATSFGYRMLDIVGNESSAGEAIRLSSVPRSRMFLSARLREHGFQEAHRGIRQSLQQLRLDYVDLYMMASPSPGRIIETWDAMVEVRKMGLARSLGVCNFELVHLEALKSHGRELPEVLQLKMNPFTWHRQRALSDWSKQHEIMIQAAGPFHAAAFQDEVLLSIPALRDHRAKSVAQVLLRWAIQMGFQVVPRSRRKDHIVENADVWSFFLSDEEMQTVSSLGSAQRTHGGSQVHAALTSAELGDTTLINRSRALLNPAAEL